MGAGRFVERLHGFYQRSSARVLARRPIAITGETPLISFTFDDFPRSALLTGGAILHGFGVAGTYYASFGLMGTDAPTGTIFDRGDLQTLVRQGHEIGCHTFEHCHSWDTHPSVFAASLARNRRSLGELLPGARFETFSYPVSPPRPATKRQTAPQFACCRGGGQTFNTGTADGNYLAAYFLEKSGEDLDTVRGLIEQNDRAGGWLILATHDVADSHTRYGCTPGFFEEVVKAAAASRARIVPVAEGWRLLQKSA